MENLMSKHRSFAEPPNKHILHWGIAAPAWGVRTGDIQGDFAHFVGYPDMKAALADQSDIATKGGWKKEETTSVLTQTVLERIFGNLTSPTFPLPSNSAIDRELGPRPRLTETFS